MTLLLWNIACRSEKVLDTTVFVSASPLTTIQGGMLYLGLLAEQLMNKMTVHGTSRQNKRITKLKEKFRIIWLSIKHISLYLRFS